MQKLTEAERAYRRGCLQTVIFLKRILTTAISKHETTMYISKMEQALLAGRNSHDNRYLGTYLDQIMQEVMEDATT